MDPSSSSSSTLNLNQPPTPSTDRITGTPGSGIANLHVNVDLNVAMHDEQEYGHQQKQLSEQNVDNQTSTSLTSSPSAATAAAGGGVVEEVTSKTANHVYVRSKDHAWIPAQVLERPSLTSAVVSIPLYSLSSASASTSTSASTSGYSTTNPLTATAATATVAGINDMAIVCDGGRSARQWIQQTIDLSEYPNQTLPLQNVDAKGSLQVVEDMVDLPFLHEAAILYNLKARHVKQLPYTRTGDIVIAVNPYQWFSDLYSLSQRLYYGQALVWNPMSSSTLGVVRPTTTSASSSPAAKQQTTKKPSTTNTNTKSTPVAEDPRIHLPPHVYEASCLAYKGLLKHNENQSILVSGESGAGKTETVKILLGDLASVQKGPTAAASPTIELIHDNTIVRKVLDSNPLLEAFGNAQTVRNDNSSRFGKYLQLQFHRFSESKCILAGSKCEVYLLEKSRVTLHDLEQERTYHILYQLLAAPEHVKQDIWAEGLTNTDNESFSYVGYTSTTSIEGKTDAERFELTIQALELIGVTGKTLRMLWRAICIVLQLGNLPFGSDPKNSDASIISDDDELALLANLMGIPAAQLSTALTIRTVQARSETFQVPLSADKAKESTDAFAKEIYAKTFLWLVRTINDATCAELNYHPQQDGSRYRSSSKSPTAAFGSSASTATTTSSTLADTIRARTAASNNAATKVSSSPTSYSTRPPDEFGVIGLLDIFGFETFQVNRFEQLCINYANEKLQQKFTKDIFQSVQAEYEMEGIELEEITYNDNTNVLDLVEGKLGLMAFLNEECVRPKGSDKTFVYKTHTMNERNPCFVRAKHAPDHEFGILHYAGIVKYDATNFVVKNQDNLPSDLQDCASFSTNDIVAKELTNDAVMNPLASAGGIGSGAGGGGPPKKRRPNAGSNASSSNNPKVLNKKRSSNIVGETVLTKFKNQLTSLMDTLNGTKTRYIRCIKPNSQKKPLVMEHLSTVEQLQCAGVVAAVTISRSAFPNRLEHVIVLERFKSLWPKGDHLTILQDMTLEPTMRLSKATDALLTIALKEMELERPSSTGELMIKQRAFVMGKTRAYFRAGALEFLEGERLRYLGSYAALVQSQIRGFCQRSKYQRFQKAVFRLQSGFRRYRLRKAFLLSRKSIIRIQCWYRLLFASRTIVHLRRQFKATKLQTRWRIRQDRRRYRSWRKASIVIQTVIRGAIQRRRYRQALKEKQEEAKLENQLASLQRKLEEAEAKREQAERDAEAKAKAALEQQVQQQQEQERRLKEMESSKRVEEQERLREEQARYAREEEELRLQQEEAERAADLEREIQMQEEQQRLMDESGRMLEYLRKEVFKLKSQNQQLKTDFELLKDNNQRLMDANASAGASFAALNQHAKQMSKQNTQLLKEVDAQKTQVQKLNLLQVELKDELKMKQASYIAEVQSRLQYQKALQMVTDLIQEQCRDYRLVEKVLQVADDCEIEYLQQEQNGVAGGGDGGGGGGDRTVASRSSHGPRSNRRGARGDDDEDDRENDDLHQSRSSIFGYLNFFSG